MPGAHITVPYLPPTGRTDCPQQIPDASYLIETEVFGAVWTELGATNIVWKTGLRATFFPMPQEHPEF
jgi:hypothetical protein